MSRTYRNKKTIHRKVHKLRCFNSPHTKRFLKDRTASIQRAEERIALHNFMILLDEDIFISSYKKVFGIN